MTDLSCYKHKRSEYFRGDRNDVVSLIPDGSHRVLELGCGEGRTLYNAKQSGKALEIVGVDIIDPVESHKRLDAYFQATGDQTSIPYPDAYFDVLICADVLEHLVNPWDTLRHFSRYLRPGGSVIASIPNARDYTLFIKVFLQGDFRYTNEGLFDKGHLRFFCKKNMRQLLVSTGFDVVKTTYNLAKVRKWVCLLSLGACEEFLVKQYIFLATKR